MLTSPVSRKKPHWQKFKRMACAIQFSHPQQAEHGSIHAWPKIDGTHKLCLPVISAALRYPDCDVPAHPKTQMSGQLIISTGGLVQQWEQELQEHAQQQMSAGLPRCGHCNTCLRQPKPNKACLTNKTIQQGQDPTQPAPGLPSSTGQQGMSAGLPRCRHCHSCRNRHLRKPCQTNQAIQQQRRESAAPPGKKQRTP